MSERKGEVGFTVAELVVTLFVMSLFVMLFYNLYMTGQSQQILAVQRAAANDIAISNLRKVTDTSLIPGTTDPCDGSTSGAGNPNNLLLNPNAPGSIIATDAAGGSPNWGDAGLVPESITATGLPVGSVVQEIRIKYPLGCANVPAEIIANVTYGTESVSHATFIK